MTQCSGQYIGIEENLSTICWLVKKCFFWNGIYQLKSRRTCSLVYANVVMTMLPEEDLQAWPALQPELLPVHAFLCSPSALMHAFVFKLSRLNFLSFLHWIATSFSIFLYLCIVWFLFIQHSITLKLKKLYVVLSFSWRLLYLQSVLNTDVFCTDLKPHFNGS